MPDRDELYPRLPDSFPKAVNALAGQDVFTSVGQYMVHISKFSDIRHGNATYMHNLNRLVHQLSVEPRLHMVPFFAPFGKMVRVSMFPGMSGKACI